MNEHDLFVFFTEDNDVAGLSVGDGTLPLVTLDRDKLESLRVMAQVVANNSASPVMLWRFSSAEHVETINPQ